MSSVEVRANPRLPSGQAASVWGAARLRLAATAGLVTGDALLVLGAFLLAHWVRFIAPELEATALGLEEYARMGAVVSGVTVLLFGLHDFYTPDRPRAWPERLQLVVSTVSTALALSVTASFFLGDQRFSRLWFAAGWAFSIVGLIGWRWLAVELYAAARDAVAPARRVLIVGANSSGRELAGDLAGRCQVVGYVDNGSDLDGPDRLPLLGPIASLERLVQQMSVDEIIVALPASRREQVGRIIARGFARPVQVKIAADLGELLPSRFEVHRHGGQSYIGFAPVARVTWIKRAFDLLVGGAIVAAFAPIVLAIALAIKLDSAGPILYRQERIGKDGVRFQMLKFRSMRQDADALLASLQTQNEASGPLFKMRDDPRVTRVGRLLRRSSLDELPQLVNVLRGEMSLVGPRPPMPKEVAQYEDWQHGRLRAVPGMTGLWQVSGRSDVPFHDMVRLDLHYIRNWSLWLDLEILVRTIPAVLGNRGAY
ncbi:MAG: sugar transferase [Chloroflexi bacterium]|nr:sugar transferase [Chloroflexota bacterium]